MPLATGEVGVGVGVGRTGPAVSALAGAEVWPLWLLGVGGEVGFTGSSNVLGLIASPDFHDWVTAARLRASLRVPIGKSLAVSGAFAVGPAAWGRHESRRIPRCSEVPLVQGERDYELEYAEDCDDRFLAFSKYRERTIRRTTTSYAGELAVRSRWGFFTGGLRLRLELTGPTAYVTAGTMFGVGL